MSNNTLASLDVHFRIKVLIIPHKLGAVNGTSKNVGLGSLGSVYDKSRSFVFSWFVFTSLSLETFYQRVSGTDF